jgi:hypothetical protein
MQYDYFMDYANYATADRSLLEFQRYCQMNIRIDEADAYDLLRRREVADSEQYNTDTVMAIICNDGHGGTSVKFVDLYINFQPKFLTASIPDATEGQVYNPKRDSTIAIRIKDANRDQRHYFYLIYEDDPRSFIPMDPAFPDETMVNISAMKTTPS